MRYALFPASAALVCAASLALAGPVRLIESEWWSFLPAQAPADGGERKPYPWDRPIRAGGKTHTPGEALDGLYREYAARNSNKFDLEAFCNMVEKGTGIDAQTLHSKIEARQRSGRLGKPELPLETDPILDPLGSGRRIRRAALEERLRAAGYPPREIATLLGTVQLPSRSAHELSPDARLARLSRLERNLVDNWNRHYDRHGTPPDLPKFQTEMSERFNVTPGTVHTKLVEPTQLGLLKGRRKHFMWEAVDPDDPGKRTFLEQVEEATREAVKRNRSSEAHKIVRRMIKEKDWDWKHGVRSAQAGPLTRKAAKRLGLERLVWKKGWKEPHEAIGRWLHAEYGLPHRPASVDDLILFFYSRADRRQGINRKVAAVLRELGIGEGGFTEGEIRSHVPDLRKSNPRLKWVQLDYDQVKTEEGLSLRDDIRRAARRRLREDPARPDMEKAAEAVMRAWRRRAKTDPRLSERIATLSKSRILRAISAMRKRGEFPPRQTRLPWQQPDPLNPALTMEQELHRGLAEWKGKKTDYFLDFVRSRPDVKANAARRQYYATLPRTPSAPLSSPAETAGTSPPLTFADRELEWNVAGTRARIELDRPVQIRLSADELARQLAQARGRPQLLQLYRKAVRAAYADAPDGSELSRPGSSERHRSRIAAPPIDPAVQAEMVDIAWKEQQHAQLLRRTPRELAELMARHWRLENRIPEILELILPAYGRGAADRDRARATGPPERKGHPPKAGRKGSKLYSIAGLPPWEEIARIRGLSLREFPALLREGNEVRRDLVRNLSARGVGQFAGSQAGADLLEWGVTGNPVAKYRLSPGQIVDSLTTVFLPLEIFGAVGRAAYGASVARTGSRSLTEWILRFESKTSAFRTWEQQALPLWMALTALDYLHTGGLDLRRSGTSLATQLTAAAVAHKAIRILKQGFRTGVWAWRTGNIHLVPGEWLAAGIFQLSVDRLEHAALLRLEEWWHARESLQRLTDAILTFDESIGSLPKTGPARLVEAAYGVERAFAEHYLQIFEALPLTRAIREFEAERAGLDGAALERLERAFSRRKAILEQKWRDERKGKTYPPLHLPYGAFLPPTERERWRRVMFDLLRSSLSGDPDRMRIELFQFFRSRLRSASKSGSGARPRLADPTTRNTRISADFPFTRTPGTASSP